MNHLFFTIGTDFEWVKGELIEIVFPGEKVEQTWASFLQEFLKTIKEEPKRIAQEEQWTGVKFPEFSFYLISLRHAHAFNVPNDVKRDWLETIIHFLKFADNAPLEWFYSDIYDPEENNIEWAHKSKKHIKKQLKLLKKQHKKLVSNTGEKE